MISRYSALALGLLATVNAVACTALEDDGTGTIEQEKRIKPQDSENLGRLTVEAPAGWTLPPDPTQDATTVYRSPEGDSDVKLGATLRTKASTGCVEVTSKFNYPTKTCGVEVKKNTLTKVKLGAIKATYDKNLLAVDFGPKPTFTIHHTEGGTGGQPEREIYRHESSYASPFWSGAPDRGVLAAPGGYRFAWNLPVLGEVKKTLDAGENATLGLVPKDVRATLVINPPATRELPNAPASGCQAKDRTFLMQRNNESQGEPPAYDQRIYGQNPEAYPDGYMNYGGSEGIVAYRSLPVITATKVKVFPFTATEAPLHYDLVVNSLVQKLDLKPGKTTTVQLERLDVDHVEVEREDGTKYTEQGSWLVWRKDATGAWVPLTARQGQYSDCSGYGGAVQATFPTGYGIDVLPGDYRIRVDYSTAEGSKNQEFVVSVP